jgi:2-oxoglutarate dehydrogenase E1 component
MTNNISVDNAGFLESLYRQYLSDKNSVDKSWQQYFSTLDSEVTSEVSKKTISVAPYDILRKYRQYAHLGAKIDPLDRLDSTFNSSITSDDLSQVVDLSDRSQFIDITLGNLISILNDTYCNVIGFEFEHIESQEEKDWLYGKVESNFWKFRETFDDVSREAFLKVIHNTKLFENYLHTKFVGAKRFSIEGGETAILALDELIRLSAGDSYDEIVLGMAHRGRLSTLVQVMGKPHRDLFAGFMGHVTTSELPSFVGDVKYHLGYENTIEVDGKTIELSLTYNPSHLESVNPVVMGISRAKKDMGRNVLPVLIHGDASFAGQGPVMESLAMSKIEPYDIGGVIHIIINNQIGFTTDPDKDRSTRYCSDIAKGYNIPIIHINGSDPEAVIYGTRLAFEYSLKFQKDIVIDLVCYRKYGHNEGDEPMFTQPSIYSQIYSKDFKDVVELYYEKLKSMGLAKSFDIDKQNYLAFLDDQYEVGKKIFAGEVPYSNYEMSDYFKNHLSLEKKYYSLYDSTNDIGTAILGNSDIASMQSAITGVSLSKLAELGMKLSTVPENFNLNGKIARQFEARKKMIETGENIDWGTGEALAFATLISEGYNIRFTGEDVERGTFSHRHSVLTDQVNGNKYIPLKNIGGSGNFYIANSLLSEFAVLGYEYGYATSNAKTLTIWEAQFGDFANGAQVIIDQYIAAAESKWAMLNNLVMLLPHGYEGQGPEHSSARLERFLQLSAQNNLQVCNCTTPASIFHLLRRQVMQDVQKPLVVMTPKSLLRHKLAVSNLSSLDSGSEFQPVIEDNLVKDPSKIIFCSGKVYYDLLEHREEIGRSDIAIVRIEQLYPFPIYKVASIIRENSKAKIIWCQEEPENMGAFSFVRPIFDSITGNGEKIKYAGRKSAASPAVGFSDIHKAQLADLLNVAFN